MLGIPYMGSKRKIAKELMDYMLANTPNATAFYDLFGGGAAMSMEALKRPQLKAVSIVRGYAVRRYFNRGKK